MKSKHKATRIQLLLSALFLGISTFSANSAPRAYSDLRQLNFTNLKANQSISLELKPGDHSLLFYARSPKKDKTLTLLEIKGPQDKLLYRYDPEDETIEGDVLQEGLYNDGEISLYLPMAPQHALEPGKYTLKLLSEAPLQEAGAIIRSGSLQAKQAIDMTFWVLTSKKSLHKPQNYQKYVQEMRNKIGPMLKPHGLELGKMNVRIGTPDMIRAYSTLQPDDDEKLHSDICQALANQTENYRQLNVAILDEIKRSPSGIKKDEGEYLGFSPGLPGMLPMRNALWSCVLMAYDESDPYQPGTLWHEGSHFMSLAHTSEEDGESFDQLSDTPECPAKKFDKDKNGLVDSEECAQQDAQNYMFWEGDATQMTAQQAWVLKRHPLFYPAN
ncbi:hypothetical protein COW36_21450 [bacterium (Candidatus Blackallbacteria) CG17_big_fil_post_rev_8_21_14_2_50_48_46]|uniref:Peptidase M43 pregnancy-associated plasma-A domain-containing protein n=1 Tax=bacterium (Candidatus Blackallbacteria) CG17_big_fil_post_rev_8_21_14_2_50_48_46 TaxID=2014261 RepID=A0A2M7FZE0_9BACT|nr:MAG: hypothetical protein COW64_14750 [bacterium (Candidatus Blackallbacteria) CG18_big_fil_WC_8_21_14_2_50_49_26]PIW14605.1 MAG: hypothetical protein COW36_21450 [bacterium (Candidatus Blackallbacteria) CG17_big_fil_post_rev_8_21_14_2_50_48_46]PIW45656.1 MAG: hypothetical protein COW20_19280 [bacterium (Candidatus Blackallbacteria) CG13_big_fil_rev_8_21_14_2_50_49_14]